MGVIMALGIILIIILIAALVVYMIGLWKVFKKAGKAGWEAIVPFYNNLVLVEIAGLGWWYALILILSSIYSPDDYNGIVIVFSLGFIVANFFVCYNLSKKFHKDLGFAFLMFFFPVIMFPLIGFSNEYQYDASVVVSENGPIDSNKVNSNQNQNYNNQNNSYDNGISNQRHFCSNCGNQLSGDTKFCGNCGNETK